MATFSLSRFKNTFLISINKYFNILTLFQKEFSSPILLTKISPLKENLYLIEIKKVFLNLDSENVAMEVGII